jgi:hypothetical protein
MRDPARKQVGPVGSVDADEAPVGPIRQHQRAGTRAERERPVEGRAVQRRPVSSVVLPSTRTTLVVSSGVRGESDAITPEAGSAVSRTDTARATVAQREAAPSPARPRGVGMANAGAVGAGSGAPSGSSEAVEEDANRTATSVTTRAATTPATSAIRADPRPGPRISR